MDEFDVRELVEYIRTGIRVVKKEGLDDEEFLVKVLQSLIPSYLNLDSAMDRVRDVAIEMGIIEDEE